MSSGSESVPSDSGASSDDSVSLVEESGDDVGVSGSGDDSDDATHVDANSGDGSGKGRGQKRRREPIVECRQWRRKAAGDGFLFDKDGRGGKGVVPMSVRGRCTLEKICKFNKTLEPHQREAIKGTILKPILEYRPFSMQRELTITLVKAWVPPKKAFTLAGRLVPFSVYDVAFFTGLPVTGKRVEFGEDDLSTTELARMVRLCMAQYVTEKSDKLKREKGSKKPVFRNYIKVVAESIRLDGDEWGDIPENLVWSCIRYMDDVRRLDEYAWAEAMRRVLVEAVEEMQQKLEGPVLDVQMNGFSLLIQVWFYEHTTRFVKQDKGSVDHRGRYDAFELVAGIKESEIIPVLRPREKEMMVCTVRDFMGIDGFRYYLLDGEYWYFRITMGVTVIYMLCTKGVLLYEEHLERAREELRVEKEKHITTERKLQFWMTRAKELEARLNMGKAHGHHPDAVLQPGGDVGVDVHNESGLEALARARLIYSNQLSIIAVNCRVGKRMQRPQQHSTSRGTVLRVRTWQPRMSMLHPLSKFKKTGPLCTEPDIVPFVTVEDVWQTPSDVVIVSSGEGKVDAHEPCEERQHPDPVLRESAAMPKTAKDRDSTTTDSGVHCVDEGDVVGHTGLEDGATIASTSLAANVEVGTPAGTKGLCPEATIEPSMQSVNDGLTIAIESIAVNGADADEASVDPPWPLPYRVALIPRAVQMYHQSVRGPRLLILMMCRAR
ncbi:LOW QUALITY PROTEIN: hypothetical protein Cgig2_033847 [Carnegiea gigantea]|uniref:Aminotransferase-like plant mobile domain-containing protein n=1 Tax=Carnegiea gigantea TaxID=171969 RepID=A0A9Q1GWU8_9CARY|nr:LOW QUALITY PROTEIN: hypothetical protein Cgig2_033847 [Carnegiea gigantea]